MTAADMKRFAGAYATLTVVLTAFLLVLGARAAEKDGLHRQVFPDVGFRGAPLLALELHGEGDDRLDVWVLR